MTGTSLSGDRSTSEVPRPVPLHPAWFALIRLCREIGHGEIERVRIQDGLPTLVELTRKKVKLL